MVPYRRAVFEAPFRGPVASSTAKKVIVRRFDRENLTGYVNSLSYLQPTTIELLKPDDEVKFVIASERDFRWAEGVMRQHRLTNRCQVLLSPAFGLVKPLDMAQWLLASGIDARMQLQLHKYVWDPKARGV